MGAEVFGVSTQALVDQQEARARLHLPFELLNDENFSLANALQLPTFDYAGLHLIKRLTAIALDGLIKKVFYPVFPPDENAGAVIAWLTAYRR